MLKELILRILQCVYENFQELYWDLMADKLHKKRLTRLWDQEFEPILYILDKYKPKSILDVGCGSGRFFQIYKDKGINKIVGVDISGRTIKIAKRLHPDVKLIKARIENIKFDYKSFDLAISVRTLQHVTKRNIEKAIENLCYSCKMIYLNELTESDGVPERIIIYKHNYKNLFKKYGFELIESGRIGRQTWMLFSDKTTSISHKHSQFQH